MRALGLSAEVSSGGSKQEPSHCCVRTAGDFFRHCLRRAAEAKGRASSDRPGSGSSTGSGQAPVSPRERRSRLKRGFGRRLVPFPVSISRLDQIRARAARALAAGLAPAGGAATAQQDSAHLLTGLSEEAGPVGVALAWKVDEGRSLNSAGNDNTYAIGDVVEITTTVAGSVTVTPCIPCTLGTAREHANFHGDRQGTALTFHYAVSNDVPFNPPAAAA